MLRTFHAGQKIGSKFGIRAHFFVQNRWKKTDRKDCVGDKNAFSCGNNDVSALRSEQSTEHLW